MSEKVISNVSDLTPIADALRSTTGSTQTYSVPELAAAAVNAITSTSKYTQPDWGSEIGVILPEHTYAIVEGGGCYITQEFHLRDGAEYVVNFNGVEYKTKGVTHNDMVVIGNAGDSGEPFCIICYGGEMFPGSGMYGSIVVLDGSASVTLSIMGDIIHEIPHEYVGKGSNPDIIIVTADAEGNTDKAKMSLNVKFAAGALIFLRIPDPNFSSCTLTLPCTAWTEGEGGFGGVTYLGNTRYISYRYTNNTVELKTNKIITN